MRRVKSRDTSPELIVRKLIWSMGYRYRLHETDLPGQPDIVFRSKKKAIFVHGCFWHQHDCPRGARTPKRNKEYWDKKLARNAQRDEENLEQLTALGWKSKIVWECELRSVDGLEKSLQEFLED